MAVINTPFESKYGFKGPGFSVDSEGNIIATSIITNEVAEDDVAIVDFAVVEVDNAFQITGLTGDNPAIEIARSKSYKFSLSLENEETEAGLGFYIYSALPSTRFNTGLTHSTGATGNDAQGKQTGTLTFNVPLSAPDTLYYGNSLGNVYGTITVVDPIGQFSSIDVNSTTNAVSSTTGAITVAGGASIEKDLHVGGALNMSGVGISRFDSLTNLELNAANKIIIQVDNVKLGEVNSSGIAATINNSTINNTPIGATTPSTAAFTTASVSSLPITDTQVPNKQYVDSTALALSIAFGL